MAQTQEAELITGIPYYSFYDVLAAGRNLPAPEGPGSLAEYRFRKASDYCSQALPGGFDRTGLRRAMRLPEAG